MNKPNAVPTPITDVEDLPLKGIRVLEFSQTVMGPCAGMLLGDMGAEVIKVEPVPTGDPTRDLRGFMSGIFATYNRNKRSIAIDCKSPEGKATIHKLVETSDVLLENFAPGTMDRLGCGWDELHAINPRLIYLTLKGFLSGPYENRAALDEVVQFMGGLAYMTGPVGRPLRAGAPVTDVTGALFGVYAVTAALFERQRTGRGKLIRSALFESVTFMMGAFMAGNAREGREMPPMPNREHSWPVYDTFETQDGKIVFVSVTSEKAWARFVGAFELPELTLGKDPRISNLSDLTLNRDWMLPLVAARMLTLTRDEIARRCEAIACGWANVSRPSDLTDDPHLNAGHMLDVNFQPHRGAKEPESVRQTRIPGIPLELDRRAIGLRQQPPLYGEHTDAVLRDLLGADKLAELKAKGVVKGRE